MSDISERADEIGTHAADWAVLCAERELTEDEQRRLDAWLGVSRRHRAAFIASLAIRIDLERVAALDGKARIS